ncbi:MAG: 4Fe-4S single cluster domain-containing protein [Myxococcota bacterium]
MRIAHTIDATEAEGPGRRFALWTQGCTLRCKGCCNPELFEATGGTERSIDSLLAEIAAVEGIEGVSILGGEPVQQADLVELCAGVRALGLTVMLYSGYRRAEIEERAPGLLAHVDLLVDGRFEATRLDHVRRWVGSTNQEIHFLTEAYGPEDPRFHEANTVELRWGPDGLVVNGWPAAARKVAR